MTAMACLKMKPPFGGESVQRDFYVTPRALPMTQKNCGAMAGRDKTRAPPPSPALAVPTCQPVNLAQRGLTC